MSNRFPVARRRDFFPERGDKRRRHQLCVLALKTKEFEFIQSVKKN